MPQTKNSARAALADAIRAQTDAQEALVAAQATSDKAQSLLCDLYAQLSPYDTLDHEIADARANLVRIALERGETPDFHAEPAGYACKLIARERIQSDIAALNESIKALEKNVATAKQQAEQAALNVEWCAEDVLAEEAETLAADYIAKLDELRATAYLLSSLALRQVRKGKDEARFNFPSSAGLYTMTAATRRINMPPIVHEALEENVVGSYERKNGFQLRNQMGALAAAHWGALLRDANAKLDPALSKTTPNVPKPDLASLMAEVQSSEITVTQ